MKKANGIKSGMVVRVNQDLRALEEGALKALRKKADAMGLRDLVERIDQERTQRRATHGRGLSGREGAWVALCGTLPENRPAREEHALVIGEKLLVEIERASLRPASKVEAERGVKWVFEMTRSFARAMEVLANPIYSNFFETLTEHREREVVGVLFNARGAPDWAPLASLRGRVVVLERSNGSFKIEFSSQGEVK